MEDIALEAAKIEVWNDLVKIGIPALAGLISGLSVSLISLFVEKQRHKNLVKQESINFQRQKVSELIESLSIFSGHLFRYVSAQIALHKYYHEGGEEYVGEVGKEMLANEYNLKKARAIANLIGNDDLCNSLEEFDKQASETIQSLVDKMHDHPQESTEALKQKERKVLNDLNKLLKTEK